MKSGGRDIKHVIAALERASPVWLVARFFTLIASI